MNGAQVGDIMATAVKRVDDSTIQIVSMNVDNFFGKADGDYLAFNLKLPKTKFYRDVFEKAPQVLNPKSFLAFEMGYNQGEALSTLAKEHFPNGKVTVHKDMSGKDRMLTIEL
jgi:methylase of polypeptide subunit release factors